MKIFEFNGDRSGTYIDSVSGAIAQNTLGSFVRTEKGIAWRGQAVATSGITIDDGFLDTVSSDAVFSIVVWFKIHKYSAQQNIIGIYNTANLDRIGLAIENGLLKFSNTTDGEYVSGAIDVGKWYCVVLTGNLNTFSMYINGVNQVGTTAPGIQYSASNIFRLGSASDTANLNFDGDIGIMEIYDHILSTKEIVKAQQVFERAAPTTKIIQ